MTQNHHDRLYKALHDLLWRRRCRLTCDSNDQSTRRLIFPIKDPSTDRLIDRPIVSAPSPINSLMEITVVSRGSNLTNNPPAPRNILWNVWKTPPTAAKLFPHRLPLTCSYYFVQIQHPTHTTNRLWHVQKKKPERHTLLKGSTLNDFKHVYCMYFDFLNKYIYLWSAIIFFPHVLILHHVALQGTAKAHRMETLTTMTSTPCLWGFLYA